jgi:hypothetical protein
MLAAIEPVAAASGVRVHVVDIDGDPALVAHYDELVPVLICDGVELARYRVEQAGLSRLRMALDGPISGGERRSFGENAR